MTAVRKIISKVAFELIVITLGVLVALGINAWYNTYQQRQQAEVLLGKIAYELTQNIQRLESAASAYNDNIIKSQRYVAELEETGESPRFEFVLKMLNVDQGAWRFSQSREELNTLPVELLIALDLANRSNTEAKHMVNTFIFEGHDDLSEFSDSDLNERYLDGVEREFKQIKFYVDYALMSSQQALSRLKEYRATGKLVARKENVTLSTEL
ncbi:hypothetical protein AN214_01641 [Pseudoalteromonas sp. P1-9]|uniref:hypothetical protein n=1 Tax=Pseudoalteromonas sp. P1-9 TaxID=1710354 RepID=UPI000707C975|nr:hypothetical protein [Pseudoalteromonas sp. P1-9]KPV96295.1 hypothetical protein AN214_01641 [Pseudoalteromonas sp. P1-9]